MKLLDWLHIHKIPYHGPTDTTGRVSFFLGPEWFEGLNNPNFQELQHMEDYKLTCFAKIGSRKNSPVAIELLPKEIVPDPPPKKIKKLVPPVELFKRLQRSPLWNRPMYSVPKQEGFENAWMRYALAQIVITKAVNRKA